jgi:hypothetical protein
MSNLSGRLSSCDTRPANFEKIVHVEGVKEPLAQFKTPESPLRSGTFNGKSETYVMSLDAVNAALKGQPSTKECPEGFAGELTQARDALIKAGAKPGTPAPERSRPKLGAPF